MIITAEELDQLIIHLPLESVLRIVVQAPDLECPGDLADDAFPENEPASGVHSTGNASPQAIKAAGGY